MAITKLPIDEIIARIHANVSDPETKKNLIEDIKKIQTELEEEKAEAKDDTPKAKNKHVFFLRIDESGKPASAGFLMKTPQDNPTDDILQKIQTASARQNDSKNKSGRGRKSKGGRIEKYYDFFFGSKRKFTKELNINPVKELIEIIVLPSEEIDFEK